MPVRTTMADLIARITDLTGDLGFSEQQIQDALDRRRTDVRLLPLTPAESIQAGGLVAFLDYYAADGDWEAGATLQTLNFVPLTETTDYTADYLVGHWTLTASLFPPCYLTGRTYDVYGTAADLLERSARLQVNAYDFSTDGQSFHRSQLSTNRLALARQYRRQARPQVIQMGRSDVQ